MELLLTPSVIIGYAQHHAVAQYNLAGSFRMLKTRRRSLFIPLSVSLLSVPVTSTAQTYLDLYNTVLNTTSNGSGISCMSCHTGSDPLGCGAPTYFQMDSYSSVAPYASSMHSRTAGGAGTFNMPMTLACAYDDAAVISAGNRTKILNWSNQGTPYSAPTTSTQAESYLSQTSVTLNGTFDTNTTNPNAVSGMNGEYYFQWRQGTSGGWTSLSTTTHNNLAQTTDTATLGSLVCGTTYQYRTVARNGHSTATDATPETIVITCTDPVISGSGTQSTNEDVDDTFNLSRSDDDAGTLTWSVQTQGSKGTYSFDTSVTGSPVTVRYDPDLNATGSDNTGVIRVTNGTTGLFDEITINMTINAQPDPPTISSGTSISLNEDNSAALDATTSAATVSGSLSLSASDPDAGATYHWDISASNDGTPNFTGATGTSPTLTYTPLQDDYGTAADNFTIRVCDGGSAGSGNCDTQVITVNLTARQDSPDATADTGKIVVEGAASTLITVVGNDTDTDAGQTATLVPSNVSVTGGVGLSINGIVGSQIDVAHDGTEEASAQLSYRAEDTDGNTSNLVTVDITISGVDDPPTGTNFTFASTVDEGSQDNEVDVIAQSNDPEGATMAVCTATLSTPTYGSVSVNGSGNVEYDHDGTNVVAASTDTDSFTYQVNDANDPTCATGNTSTPNTVTINLAPTNDRPVAVNDSFTVLEGGTFTSSTDLLDQGGGTHTSVVDNDTDEENGTGTGMSVTANTSPAHETSLVMNGDGTFTYTHDSTENFSDSFDYTVNDGTADALADGTVTITITPVNDAPSITSTAPTTANVFTEEVPATIYQLTQTDSDDDSWTYSLGGTGLSGDTGAGDMAISVTGEITWTPPRTGSFTNDTAMVTVTVSDENDTAGGNGIQQAVQMFQVRTAPLDSDSDGIADYSDNCPSDPNGTQDDYLDDTQFTAVDTSGIPATGDVIDGALDANGFVTGGDVCDEDDDDDGMPDAFEMTYAGAPCFLNHQDPSDGGATDCDADGLTNLQEYLAGSDPSVDSVPPSITVPADIVTDATGFYTPVDLGEASVSDGNDGSISTVVPVVDTVIASCNELDDHPVPADPFRPGSYTVNWSTCDAVGNVSTAPQSVTVRPLLSVSSGQVAGEGQTVTVDFELNGTPAVYPVNVNFTIGGTASLLQDYTTTALGSTVISNPDTSASISFDITSDATAEAQETIVIELTSADQAALGVSTIHTITIIENNLAPQVDIDVSQGGNPTGSTIYADAGMVTLMATVSDPNIADAHTYLWDDMSASTTQNIMFDPTGLGGMVQTFNVNVDDGSSSTDASIELVIIANEPTGLPASDTDGDMTNDDVEGAGDSDGDGIPDYLDDDRLPSNTVASQTGANVDLIVLETEPGLTLSLGTTSQAAEAMGARVSGGDIEDHGGVAGGVGVNTDDTYVNVGGYFDFEISGLSADQDTAQIVLPLGLSILPDAEYRKYDGTSWSSFVVDSKNNVKSATGEPGACPSPGSSEYTDGLTAFDYCIQLTIEDGGPNDTDGLRDYVIRDPGGVGIPASTATATPSGDGRLGVMHPLVIVLIGVVAGLIYRRRKS